MATFFEAMVLKLCIGYLVHITERVWNFLRFCPFGPELWGKGFFSKVGLSHFFYVEANVRISYMVTFFEAMVLKLCTGYLVHGVRLKSFFDFAHSGLNYGEKGFFSKVGLFIFSTLMQILHGHFFWSYGFETLHRLSSPYYGVRVKFFCDFVHSGSNYEEKGFI